MQTNAHTHGVSSIEGIYRFHGNSKLQCWQFSLWGGMVVSARRGLLLGMKKKKEENKYKKFAQWFLFENTVYPFFFDSSGWNVLIGDWCGGNKVVILFCVWINEAGDEIFEIVIDLSPWGVYVLNILYWLRVIRYVRIIPYDFLNNKHSLSINNRFFIILWKTFFIFRLFNEFYSFIYDRDI